MANSNYDNLEYKNKNLLAQKLLVYILLSSAFLAILSISFQLYLDYERDLGQIDKQIKLVENSYIGQLAEHVWSVDRGQAEIVLTSIISLPDIQYVELVEKTTELSINFGKKTDLNSTTHRFTLEHVISKEETVPLGYLSINTSLDNVYSRLRERVLTISVTQSIKALFVALFIFLITYQLITRHLATISKHVTTINLNTLDNPLELRRKPSNASKPDELDQVVSSLNDMHARIQSDITARMLVEKVLIRNQQMLIETGKIGKIGGWEVNIDTRETWWTEEVYHIHEVRTDSKYNVEGGIDFYTDTSKPLITEAVQRAIEHGEPYDLELELITAKGNLRHVHTVGMPDLEHRRVRGTIQDITEKRQQGELLRRANENLLLAQRIANIGHWTLDTDTGVIEWSDEVYRIYERDPQEGTYSVDEYLEMLKGESLEIFTSAIQRAILEGQPYDIELKNEISPGRVKWIRSICEPERKVGSKGYVLRGTLHDITKRKQTETTRDLRMKLMELDINRPVSEIHQQTLDILEEQTSSTIGFYHHYDNSEQQLSLQAWSTKTDSEFCHVKGEQIHYPLESAGVWADAIKKGKTIIHNDFKTVAGKKGLPDGHAAVIRELVVPIIRRDEVVAILGLGNKPTPYTEFDIALVTELADLSWEIACRRIYEDELVDARRSSDQANIAKSRFLANMSHEIRTPLNGILGMLQILEEMPLEHDEQECVSIAKSSGENLLSLLADILDISSIEAGKLLLVEGVIDFEELEKNTHSLFRPVLKTLPLRLSFKIDKNLPKRIVSYPVRVKQIIFNLIGNAVKYTPEGEVVCAIKLSTIEGKEAVEVKITDNGVGIPDDKIHHVFEPFAQVDNSYKRKFQGAGLGLAIVQRLITLLKGEIEFKSKENVGTTVTITIPVSLIADEDSKMIEPVTPTSGDFSSLSVLVVEDNVVNMKTVTMLLEKMGVTVSPSVNGKEALEILQRDSFDLVFMDIEMPVMDGIEATSNIRSGTIEGIATDIPIVALTAYAMEGDAQKFLDVGMDAYLSKPINVRSLKVVLSRYGLGEV